MVNLSFVNKNTLPIWLDIGHGWIKMVQLVRNDRISVVSAEKSRAERELTDPSQSREHTISSIKEMLGRGSFEGREVVSALAYDKLNVTSLRLPQMTDGQTEKAVRNEAKERFGLDSVDDVITYLPVGQVKHEEDVKNELVVFAANGDVVREHIEILEQAGLTPVGLDPIPCALFRSFDRAFRREEDWQETLVFVDVGRCGTTVVFGRGGEIAFIKEIPIGTQRFDAEISDKLGVTPAEAQLLRSGLGVERKAAKTKPGTGGGTAVQTQLDASTRQVIVDAVGAVSQELAREISLCFRYYTVTFRGKRVKRAIFAGGGAYENILLNVMRRQLTVEIQVAKPFRGFDLTKFNFENNRRGSLCEWAVAVGLALKRLEE